MNRLLKKYASTDYTPLYQGMLGLIRKALNQYNDISATNEFNQDRDSDKDPCKELRKRTHSQWNSAGIIYRKFCPGSPAAFPIPTDRTDPVQLNNFLKQVWMAFINEMQKMGKLSAFKNLTYNNHGTSWSVEAVRQEILKNADVAASAIDATKLNKEDCAATYYNVTRASDNYKIFFQIDENDPRNATVAVVQNNQTLWAKPCKNTANKLLSAFNEAQTFIESKVKRADSTTGTAQLKNTTYARKCNNTVLQTAGINESQLADWEFELENKSMTQDFNPVDVEIQMTYSNLTLLNTLLNQAAKNKQPFKFYRINTASRLKQLVKTAVTGTELFTRYQATYQQIEKHQISVANLIAIYFNKKIDNPTEGDPTDQCCGIMIKDDPQGYIIIPATAYSSITAMEHQYNRIKSNQGFISKHIFSPIRQMNVDVDFSQGDWWNQLPGVKEFTSVADADRYAKQTLYAQERFIIPEHRQLFPASDTVEETKIALKITFRGRNQFYEDTKLFVEQNKEKILNYTEVVNQLNAVPMSKVK